MPEQIENRMVVDYEWEDCEVTLFPSERRLKRERQAFEEAEYGMNDELIRD